MFNWKCTDIRPNHFKSALGGATYVYASWDSLPPSVGGAEPRTEAQTRLWQTRRMNNPLLPGRLSQVQA